jgi:hypothetical protein
LDGLHIDDENVRKKVQDVVGGIKPGAENEEGLNNIIQSLKNIGNVTTNTTTTNTNNAIGDEFKTETNDELNLEQCNVSERPLLEYIASEEDEEFFSQIKKTE